MKHQIQDDQGQVWEFDTDNGCLLHPGGMLTSWLRDNRPVSWWAVLEDAADINPIVLQRINNLECGGDPSRRFVEGTPEAATISRELDRWTAVAEKRHRDLQKGAPSMASVTHPADLLQPAERHRVHELKLMTRPVSREEAAESVRLRRIKRLQAQQRHTAQSLVHLVRSAGGKHDITHPTWMKEVMLGLLPLLPETTSTTSVWDGVTGEAFRQHTQDILAFWGKEQESAEQRAVAILMALILSRQEDPAQAKKDRAVGMVGNFSAAYGPTRNKDLTPMQRALRFGAIYGASSEQLQRNIESHAEAPNPQEETTGQ